MAGAVAHPPHHPADGTCQLGERLHGSPTRTEDTGLLTQTGYLRVRGTICPQPHRAEISPQAGGFTSWSA